MSQSSHTDLWGLFQDGVKYQQSMGFVTDFPEFVRFKEGDQWPQPKPETRNLPRPVFNIVDWFIRAKRASVVNQPITISYSPGEVGSDEQSKTLAQQGAEDFTEYGRQLWKRTHQDALNVELVDDAATLGTGILHYYNDMSVKGGALTAPWIGEIRGETIDPLNFFVAEPQVRDVQTQPWVLIAQRTTVNAVREKAKLYGVKPEQMELIVGDDDTTTERYDSASKEMDGEKRITLLRRYSRDEHGEVVYDLATKNVTLCKGQSLTPEDASSAITLYPVAVMNWYMRKKCLYGIGEAQSMIPAQKAINFLKAMELLSVQQTAWPKIVAKQGALHQKITNAPGEIITDYSPQGQGFYYLAPPVLSAAATNLTETILQLMRTTSGVNEATTGESMGASMAASAIIALQAQAKTPIEEIQKRYWLCIEDVGRIWAQMIKTYYISERAILPQDTVNIDGEASEPRVFQGSAYSGIDFDLRIDVGASSEYGEVLAQATLDMMLQRGDITIDQYVELAPPNVVPFKEQFKRMREQSGQAAQALQEQAMLMAQSGMPLPGTDIGEGAVPTAGTNPTALNTPPSMQRPAGVGGMMLPSIPTAPSIPAVQGGNR